MSNTYNQFGFSLSELRHGTQLLYNSSDGKLITSLDWQDLKWAHDQFEGFVKTHNPIVLDDEILGKVFYCLDSNIHPKAFVRENGCYLYHTPEKDGRIFYVCQMFTKSDNPKAIGWDVGISRSQNDEMQIVPLRHILDNPLLYFHQLQNIFLDLFGFDLRVSKK
ncbi:MAG: hypothetical protein ABJH04_07855 [Cyclobacteriaceae bacterium]